MQYSYIAIVPLYTLFPYTCTYFKSSFIFLQIVNELQPGPGDILKSL